MGAVLRGLGAIVVGMATAFLMVVAVEYFGNVVHPLPPDFGGTEDEMCAHVERFPSWALAVVIPMWMGTAFVGTWVGGRLGNRWCALIVGLLLFAAVAFNVSMLPYPAWFKVACLIAIPAGSVAGVFLALRRRGAA